MKAKLQASVGLLLVALMAATVYWWVQNAPRREALASLARLESALNSADHTELLNLIVIPAAIQGRTALEQYEFLINALHDEISSQGLKSIKQHGSYGSLKKLFPNEAEAWTEQAGVNPDDCVAFKLERHGLRAEVVLEKLSTRETPYRTVRVNNVKQMAGTSFLTLKK